MHPKEQHLKKEVGTDFYRNRIQIAKNGFIVLLQVRHYLIHTFGIIIGRKQQVFSSFMDVLIGV